ncbi:MAG: hypothetical protein ACLQVY_14010 [Limisphaerales bacterium]
MVRARWRISRWLCVLIAALLAAAAPCRAESTHPHMENRFLFIVETSSDMKSRADEVTRAVVGLLNSDLNGELRQGDTIGLWTYSASLHPEFPMQVWSGEKKEEIAELARQYLRQVRFERLGRLDKVWPALRQAVAKSERLTVIFIYDSDEIMRGTPFDRDINALQKKYRREFHTENLPVVTVLSARGGQFFDYTINYPGSISLPHTANPLPPPETNAPPVVAAPPPPAPPAPTNPPVEAKPLRVIEIVRKTPTTNGPAPATVNATPVAPPLAIAPEAKPLRTIEIANNNPAPATLPPTAVTPPSAALETTAAVVASPPVATTQAVSPPPATAAPAALANANVAAAPAPASRTESSPAVVPPVAPAPQPAPMPVTIASTGQQAALFVIAISLLVIAAALVIFLLRRSRGAHSSLISQVIDRPR